MKKTIRIKPRLKKGDLVKVVSGRWTGTIDYISQISAKKGVVYLKKVSCRTYERQFRKKDNDEKQREVMFPLPLCKVSYWMENKKCTTRVGFTEIDGKKKRQSHKYNTQLI